MTAQARLALALALAAAGAIAAAAALLMVGGPGAARLERLDGLRVREAIELVAAIERHRMFTGRLPESLEAVRPTLSGPPPVSDPGTGEPYGYEILDESRFRVCARLSSPEAALEQPGPVRLPESRWLAAPSRVGDRICWESARAPR